MDPFSISINEKKKASLSWAKISIYNLSQFILLVSDVDG